MRNTISTKYPKGVGPKRTNTDKTISDQQPNVSNNMIPADIKRMKYYTQMWKFKVEVVEWIKNFKGIKAELKIYLTRNDLTLTDKLNEVRLGLYKLSSTREHEIANDFIVLMNQQGIQNIDSYYDISVEVR